MLSLFRLGCMEVGDLCRISIHLKMFVYFFAYENFLNIVLTGQTKIASHHQQEMTILWCACLYIERRSDLLYCSGVSSYTQGAEGGSLDWPVDKVKGENMMMRIMIIMKMRRVRMRWCWEVGGGWWVRVMLLHEIKKKTICSVLFVAL